MTRYESTGPGHTPGSSSEISDPRSTDGAGVPTLSSEAWGDERIRRVELRNARGLKAVLSNHGARLVELWCPDRDGHPADVVLGFDDPLDYERRASLDFGATIGRVANRIAGGRFLLDGEEFQLARNEGCNHLHGGARRSFDQVIWDSRVLPGRPAAVRFGYVSPHLEEGYPGELRISTTYALTDDDELRIDFLATTDRATPVNLTNHSYWNLHGGGGSTILDHELTVRAEAYTPTDDELIPDGGIVPVAGTALDFRSPQIIGSRIDGLRETPARGYDHNYVLSPHTGLKQAALLHDPCTGRLLEVLTTEPALQVYTGNQLTTVVGKKGAMYPTFGGVCLEPQHFPDSVHHDHFPSVILRPGETYRQTMVFRLSAR